LRRPEKPGLRVCSGGLAELRITLREKQMFAESADDRSILAASALSPIDGK
jgi:hypothetical protein